MGGVTPTRRPRTDPPSPSTAHATGPTTHTRKAVADEIDPLALERQVCFALSVASRSVVALYRPLLEPMGLTHPQYLVMLALWERSPRSLRDLGDALQLDPGTVSPLVKRLEAGDLLTRTRHPQDERTLQLELTAKGRQLRTQATEIPGKVVELLGIPVGDLEHMHAILTNLIATANRVTQL